MKQNRHNNSGNTLTEYAIILALLAVAAVGSLSLMGQSTSGLLGSFTRTGTNSSVLADMAHIQFNGAENNNAQNGGALTSKDLNALGADGSGNDAALSSLDGSAMYEVDESAGGGVNATSVDGNKKVMQDTAYKTLASARRLQDIANSLPEGSEKLWLTHDVIPRMMSLAAAEGYAAEIPSLRDNVKSKSYTTQSALKDIAEIQNQLAYKTSNYSYVVNYSQGELYANPSPELAKQVQSILNQAIQGTKTFIPNHKTNTSNLSWDIDILKAYGGSTDLAIDIMSDSASGYDAAKSNVRKAQADGTIRRSEPTASTADGADTLDRAARWQY